MDGIQYPRKKPRRATGRNFSLSRRVLSAMTNEGVLQRPVANQALGWAGVCFSLFPMLIVRQAFPAISTEPGPGLVMAREACMFACAGAIVWLMRKREGLPLSSIGIGTSPIWKSVAWGLVTAVACVIPGLLIAQLTGYGHGAGSQAFAKLPVWVIFTVVVRAGVVEELFFRGYAIERLRMLGVGRVLSWAIPLAVFSVGHWTGGAANILIAAALGGILTAFYLWRRDLVANMFGHFLVDFAGNVLPALFH